MTARRRIGWIVLGAIAAGLASAIVLVLGLLGGAPENVLTGTAFLAFAAGWALLAIGSTRWTDQPQRWATVPAMLFALIGGAFLAWPGAVTRAEVAWALPAIMLALAAWMSVQAHRSLHSRARRWVLYPLFGVMALASVAAGVETAREKSDRLRFVTHGRLLDVGGYRLNLACAGTGSPTVLLVPGAGEPSAVWAWIAPMVARGTRVCVYDRAGRAWSDAGLGPQDGIALSRDLHLLLAAADVTEPVVLVGHSFGGLYVRAYASLYPAHVAGVVLLDATHPGMFSRIPIYPVLYEGYRRVSALFPALARFGVGRIAYRTAYDHLPAEVRAEQRAIWSTAAHARSARDEWAEAPAAMRQAAALTSLGARPLIVVTALRDSQDGWVSLQAELASLSSNSVHRVVAEATHMSLVDTQDGAAASIQAIHDVVSAVRTAQPLRHP